MTRATTKLGLAAAAAGGLVVAGLAIFTFVAAVLFFVGLPLLAQQQQQPSPLFSSPLLRREIRLAHDDALVIESTRRDRSEHGFSQRAGYRAPGSAEIEWFGEVSDGVEPQVYSSGTLVVVIDTPAACLFVRNPDHPQEKWKSFALVFPDDLGQFPLSFYAQRNRLTVEEVARIDALGGGKREEQRKYPTTYIQSFDPQTRDLTCAYHLDNQSAWPLHLRLSEDGSRLLLVAIGGAAASP